MSTSFVKGPPCMLYEIVVRDLRMKGYLHPPDLIAKV